LPIIRVELLQPADRLLAELGLNLNSIIRKEGLLRISDAMPLGFYPYRDAMRILGRAAELSGIEHMGFALGKTGSLASLGAYGDYIASAPTLYAATIRAGEFCGWACPQVKLDLRRSGSAMVWQTSHPFVPGTNGRHGYLHTIALLIEVIRRALGPDWMPAELRIGDRSLCNASAESSLGCSFRHTEGEWGLVFPRAALSLPMAPWPEETPAPTPEDLTSTLVSPDFPTSVAALIRSYLSSGRINEDVLAHSSGLSLRTFQRHLLQTENGSFRRLIAEIRLKEACNLLSDEGVRMRDVARALGYSEQANFTRAFVRWTGLTPSAYRGLKGELRIEHAA